MRESYLEVFLDGGSFLEFNIRGCGDSQQVLEPVDDGVGGRSEGWVAHLETHRCQLAHTFQEFHAEVLRLDVQNLRLEDRAGVVNHLDNQTVVERGDVQHVKKGSFAGAYFVAFLQDVHVILKQAIHVDHNSTLRTCSIKFYLDFSPITVRNFDLFRPCNDEIRFN